MSNRYDIRERDIRGLDLDEILAEVRMKEAKAKMAVWNLTNNCEEAKQGRKMQDSKNNGK